MAVNEKIVVKDACVLFDLIDLGLVAAFFQLDLIVFTTPQVLSEIVDPLQMAEVDLYIVNGKLMIESSGLLETIVEISDTHPGLSFTDSSVLELALRINGVVLSSDKSLRNVATRQNLQVRGVLWIIEELYNHNIITLDFAVTKLQEYPRVNDRAPVKETGARINKLRGPA